MRSHRCSKAIAEDHTHFGHVIDRSHQRERSAAIEVTDGMGRYRATLQLGTFPKPTILIQQDLNKKTATIWTIDPRNNQVGGPPHNTTYTTTTVRSGREGQGHPPCRPLSRARGAETAAWGRYTVGSGPTRYNGNRRSKRLHHCPPGGVSTWR